MAPVEIDHIPRSFSLETLNLKVVDKAMELPLVNSAYSEVTRMASPISPYVESTLTKVEAGYKTIKTQVEEKVVPHIPQNISSHVSATMETVTAAVEKVDSFACSGIDQLTEKVPQLKEATPTLVKDTKSSVTSYVSAVADFAASFSVAQVALKIADASLAMVEQALKKAGTAEESSTISAVKMLHTSANDIRISGVKKAGTEKATMLEKASITEALMFVLGINGLLSYIGYKCTTAAPAVETAKTDAEVPAKHDAEVPVEQDAEVLVELEAEVPVELEAEVVCELPAEVSCELPAKLEAEVPVELDAEVPAKLDAEVPVEKDAEVLVELEAEVPVELEADMLVELDAVVPIENDAVEAVEFDSEDSEEY